ncbi:MAG: hypothetical protein AAFQ13_03160, partial [Pseudomonadota bacterium]
QIDNFSLGSKAFGIADVDRRLYMTSQCPATLGLGGLLGALNFTVGGAIIRAIKDEKARIGFAKGRTPVEAGASLTLAAIGSLKGELRLATIAFATILPVNQAAVFAYNHPDLLRGPR